MFALARLKAATFQHRCPFSDRTEPSMNHACCCWAMDSLPSVTAPPHLIGKSGKLGLWPGQELQWGVSATCSCNLETPSTSLAVLTAFPFNDRTLLCFHTLHLFWKTAALVLLGTGRNGRADGVTMYSCDQTFLSRHIFFLCPHQLSRWEIYLPSYTFGHQAPPHPLYRLSPRDFHWLSQVPLPSCLSPK